MAKEELRGKGTSRRDFIKGVAAGVIGSGAIVSGIYIGPGTGLVSEVGTGGKKQAPLPASKGYIASFTSKPPPRSEGYILVDTKKCASCQSCMVTCSMTHHGKANVSLSRIQIYQNSMGHYPVDVYQAQCRQCVYPMCLAACPTGALHIDENFGNIRTVDVGLCIGCQRCIEACPFISGRAIWNFKETHSQKCDLCANTPYWNEAGGPGGKQACVEVCPMQAIKFTTEVPSQIGDVGYNVNLRKPIQKMIGLEIE